MAWSTYTQRLDVLCSGNLILQESFPFTNPDTVLFMYQACHLHPPTESPYSLWG